jgi:nucleoside-diphosphate-sugar epimerase
MKVLVTGGGGFLGGAIVKGLLARGHSVRVLGRHDYPALRSTGVELFRADVADALAVRAAVDSCDAVVHTAARVGSWGRYRHFHETNVTGTENVLTACKACGVQRLVFTSSPSVVHSGLDAEGIDESSPYARTFEAHYPRTKAQAERLVLAANDERLATIALRPHLIMGPGDTQLLPRVAAKARAGRLFLPGGPPKLVDWTYIDDAAQAHWLALERLSPTAPCAGRAYFISQGAPVTVVELITRILAAAGVSAPQRTLSPALLYLAGCLAEGLFTMGLTYDREPPITRFVARQLTTSHWFNISAARRDLGYEPTVTLDQALEQIGNAMTS